MEEHDLDLQAFMEKLGNSKKLIEPAVCYRQIHHSGWQSGTRRFREHIMVFLESGQMEADIDGKVHTLAPGDTAWIFPGEERTLRGGAETSYRLRFLDHAWKDNKSTRLPASIITDTWENQPLLYQLAEVMADKSPAGAYRRQGLLLAIIAGMVNLAEKKGKQERTFSRQQERKVRQFLAENLHLPLATRDLAREVDMSEAYTRRLFKGTFGLSLRSWLVCARMERAAILLQDTTGGIKEIAREVGINDPVLFHRQFRSIHGCTPGQYRKT